MATYNGANYKKQYVDVPNTKIPSGEQSGILRVAYDSYALVGDLSSNDVIRMMYLPAGARVIDVMLAFDDLDASGGTLDVGWAASADAVESAQAAGFISAADCTVADVIKMSDNLANGTGQFKQFASPVLVQVKVNGDTDATSGTIKLCVKYVID
jgi:hypothetical protein